MHSGEFSGKDCLYVAQFLGGREYGPCTSESSQRAAVSRAYFAAYGHAFHIEVGGGRYRAVTSNRGENHWKIRKHFNDRGQARIATKLEQLSIWRQKCDYSKSFIVNLPMMVKCALDNAEHIILNVK